MGYYYPRRFKDTIKKGEDYIDDFAPGLPFLGNTVSVCYKKTPSREVVGSLDAGILFEEGEKGQGFLGKMEAIDYHGGERSRAEFDVDEMKIVWSGSQEDFEVSDRIGRLVASDEVDFCFPLFCFFVCVCLENRDFPVPDFRFFGFFVFLFGCWKIVENWIQELEVNSDF